MYKRTEVLNTNEIRVRSIKLKLFRQNMLKLSLISLYYFNDICYNIYYVIHILF